MNKTINNQINLHAEGNIRSSIIKLENELASLSYDDYGELMDQKQMQYGGFVYASNIEFLLYFISIILISIDQILEYLRKHYWSLIIKIKD